MEEKKQTFDMSKFHDALWEIEKKFNSRIPKECCAPRITESVNDLADGEALTVLNPCEGKIRYFVFATKGLFFRIDCSGDGRGNLIQGLLSKYFHLVTPLEHELRGIKPVEDIPAGIPSLADHQLVFLPTSNDNRMGSAVWRIDGEYYLRYISVMEIPGYLKVLHCTRLGSFPGKSFVF